MQVTMTLFKFDPRGLPDSLRDKAEQRAFVEKVSHLLQNDASDHAYLAAVVGMLVLDGYTDPSSASFANGFWTIRGEASGSIPAGDGGEVPNKHVYDEVADQLQQLPAHGKYVYFQELAAVSRQLIENALEVRPKDDGFLAQVRVFADRYVQNGPEGETLDLPDLSAGDAAGDDDIKADNIRAVAVIYAAHQLEQLRLFQVVDRITETFMNGQLPVGFDRGGRALDDYYWSSELRLSEPARHMQYSRVLGAPGGEVSNDVQPNTQFDDLLMRFLAVLADYDRQQRVADIVGGQRTSALSLTGEQVRAAGRNLAANASLYGWGGTQFAARRLAEHVQKAVKILNTPEIQNAYGVDGPWKVVERVSSQEFGASANIVKYKTMADAGQKILNLVAKYAAVWPRTAGQPLFADEGQSGTAAVADALAAGFAETIDAIRRSQTTAATGAPKASSSRSRKLAVAVAPDISRADQDELMRQSGNWLAVNGIRDDQVEQYSQPSEAQYAPSIPSLAPAAPAQTNGGAGLDQLRAMVSSGQVPSLDQLKSLVMPGQG